MYKSKVSRVSEVSTVSEVSKMLKQGEQQSLHSLRPLGEGGRRPDEGADKSALTHCETTKESHKSVCPPLEGGPKSLISRRGADKSALTYGEKMQCNGNEMLKQSWLLALNGSTGCSAGSTPPCAPFALCSQSAVQDDGTRHKAAKPASCKSLVPQCLSNLVPSFAPSVRKSASALFVTTVYCSQFTIL